MKKIAGCLTKVIDRFYIPPLRKVIPLQTFRYAACGGFNMVLDTLLFAVLYNYVFARHNLNLGFIVISPHIAALCVVFPITFLNGFLLNRYVAFKESPLRTRIQFLRYGLSVSVAFMINYALMKIFIETLHIYPIPSKILTTIITIVYSYIAQKYYTFRGCSEK